MEKNINNKLRLLIEKINFDTQLGIRFLFWIIIWTVCSNIIIFYIPQINIFQVQHDILPTLYQIVGTILISLFIFIAAEGMRDRNEKYKLQILLKESKLPTVIILFLFSITILPFVQYRIIFIIALGSLMGFIFLSINAVYKIISIIRNATELWKYHRILFTNRIKKVTQFAINIRLENKNLSNILNKYKNDYIRIWFPERDAKCTFLKSKQEGTITSMSLDKLEDILQDIIDCRPIEKKVSKGSEITPQPPSQSTSDNFLDYKINESQYVNLYIQVGNQIKEGAPLLSFSNQLQINDNLKEKLQDQLNNLIQVERLTVVDEVRDEIEGHRDKVKQLIKEENVLQFKKYLDLYFDSVKEFVNQILKHGLFSYEESKKEMNSISLNESEGWPPLIWFKDHIMDFFKNSIELDSNKIYENIKWFSYHLIKLSQEKNDHLIFRETLFLWLRQLYHLSEYSFKDKEKKMKNHADFFETYIISLIFSNIRESSDTLSKKESYAIHLLEIVKSMFECILKRELYFLLNNFQEIIIKIVNDDDKLAEQSINVMKIFTQDNSIFEDQNSYKSRKLQFLFGFGVCLEQLKSNMSQLTEFKELQKSVEGSIPILLKEYLKIYPLICNENVNKFWQWSFFNMPTNMEFKQDPWDIDRDTYFLKLLSKIPENEFKSLKINQLDPKTLLHLKSLDVSLTRNSQTPCINSTIKEFFKKITKHQHQQREKYIGRMELNTDKVQHFIDVFSEEFKKKPTMRHLFKKRNISYKNKENMPIFSINIIEPKDYFLSDKEELELFRARETRSLSISFSDGFIESENKFLQDEILKKCTKKEVIYSSFKEELINRKWKDSERLILDINTFNRIAREYPIFKIEENKSTKRDFFKQCLKIQNRTIPFSTSNLRKTNIRAMIFDTSKLPILEMFNPAEKQKDTSLTFQFLEDIGISVGIGNFSHNTQLMNNILKKPPEWLSKIGNKKDQREYLTQHVNIMIAQGINLNWKNIQTPIGTGFIISDLSN